MPPRFASLEISDPVLSPEGLRFVTAKSRHLGRRGDVTFFAEAGVSGYRALVVLLHGVYGSHWAWCFQGGAHRVATTLLAEGKAGPFILAMPSDGLWGDGSGYLQHEHADYESWIMDDVPALAVEVYGARAENLPVCLSGLSMGGFGALRLGARHARRVAAVSAHSSATNRAELQSYIREPLDARFEDLDLAELWSKARAACPPLRFDCGKDDPAWKGNRRLHEQLDAAGVPHIFEELPGAHDWKYWQAVLPRSLEFFQQQLAPPAWR